MTCSVSALARRNRHGPDLTRHIPGRISSRHVHRTGLCDPARPAGRGQRVPSSSASGRAARVSAVRLISSRLFICQGCILGPQIPDFLHQLQGGFFRRFVLEHLTFELVAANASFPCGGRSLLPAAFQDFSDGGRLISGKFQFFGQKLQAVFRTESACRFHAPCRDRIPRPVPEPGRRRQKPGPSTAMITNNSGF